MDQSTKTSATQKLQPPEESSTSVVLNSVGNGMMLGAIPFIAFEARALITQKPMSRPLSIASIAATAVGGVLGWVFGEREAKLLKDYRQSVTDEVVSLRSEVEQLKQEKGRWQSKIAAESKDIAADEKESSPISL